MPPQGSLHQESTWDPRAGHENLLLISEPDGSKRTCIIVSLYKNNYVNHPHRVTRWITMAHRLLQLRDSSEGQAKQRLA